MLSPTLLRDMHSDNPIDIHLMVQKPSQFFPIILKYKQVKAVAFHIEIVEDIRENISFLRSKGVKV